MAGGEARAAGACAPPIEDGARKRAAVETYARHESALRRTARRYSICDDDADDALQRGLEILLTKAPTTDQRDLVRWTQTVVKHEALAVRSERERILAGPAAAPEPGVDDWVALIPAPSDGPPERAERQEAIARSREALQALKPPELRALTLLAEGYSYAEIGEITGFSRTKINRSLAEGRERFRALLSRSEDGRRCAELRPLLSAFCDGEADGADATAVREHLRACAHCRATLRSYRAAPAAAAALAPVLPLHRSLLDRVHDAVLGLAARINAGGSGDSGLTQAVAGGGTRGAGMAVLAKALAVCAGTVGGAAACLATGMVPAPFDVDSGKAPQTPRLERRIDSAPEAEVTTAPEVEYEAEPEAPTAPTPHEPKPEAAAPEPTAASAPPATSGGAVEYAPPPAPQPTSSPSPSSSSGAGSAAGEFGP